MLAIFIVILPRGRSVCGLQGGTFLRDFQGNLANSFFTFSWYLETNPSVEYDSALPYLFLCLSWPLLELTVSCGSLWNGHMAQNTDI